MGTLSTILLKLSFIHFSTIDGPLFYRRAIIHHVTHRPNGPQNLSRYWSRDE